MRNVIAFTPFAIVGALALALGTGAILSTSSPLAPRPPAAAPGSGASAVPTGTATLTPSARADAPDEMLRVHNELRSASGAPAVRSDERVSAAAQRHAEYLARNGTIGHDETPGADGFTGTSVRDRLAAQGYTDSTASEVATSFGSGVDGVRSLWVLPYHRLGLMHPHAIVAGWGHAELNGRTATVGVLVYDFASTPGDLVRSPSAGQRVPGTWHGEESPGVLPAGAARPVGYPVMLVAVRAKPVVLRAARLTDAAGRELAHYIVPQIYERDYVGIVPAAPLAGAGRYRVRLELEIGDATVVEEWEFMTEP